MGAYNFDKEVLLKKFPGKGGWTYAELEGIQAAKSSTFGWTEVSGWIDTFELLQYKLMPMGEGRLFLPVKTEIRKKIKKEAGETVHIKLRYIDATTENEEIYDCLKDVPGVFEAFNKLSQKEKDEQLQKINASKHDEEKIQRIEALINSLK